MKTTEINKQSSDGIFGEETLYSFNLLADNGNPINTYSAVVDSYEDEEYIVYFFDTLTTSKEHKFKLAHKAHSFALSQLNKTKVEVLNFV